MRDNELRYGGISRALHWLMAVLFAWQFVSAILHAVAKDAAISKFFWGTHFSLGFALLLLVLVRGVWGLTNFGSRPVADGMKGKLAHSGHLFIYALMIVVPAVALLRTFGSGRGFSFLGVQIFEATGVKDPAMMEPGNALHGLLGWVLLATIVGHVVMAMYHQAVLKDQTLQKMVGSR